MDYCRSILDSYWIFFEVMLIESLLKIQAPVPRISSHVIQISISFWVFVKCKGSDLTVINFICSPQRNKHPQGPFLAKRNLNQEFSNQNIVDEISLSSQIHTSLPRIFFFLLSTEKSLSISDNFFSLTTHISNHPSACFYLPVFEG